MSLFRKWLRSLERQHQETGRAKVRKIVHKLRFNDGPGKQNSRTLGDCPVDLGLALKYAEVHRPN